MTPTLLLLGALYAPLHIEPSHYSHSLQLKARNFVIPAQYYDNRRYHSRSRSNYRRRRYYHNRARSFRGPRDYHNRVRSYRGRGNYNRNRGSLVGAQNPRRKITRSIKFLRSKAVVTSLNKKDVISSLTKFYRNRRSCARTSLIFYKGRILAKRTRRRGGYLSIFLRNGYVAKKIGSSGNFIGYRITEKGRRFVKLSAPQKGILLDRFAQRVHACYASQKFISLGSVSAKTIVHDRQRDDPVGVVSNGRSSYNIYNLNKKTKLIWRCKRNRDGKCIGVTINHKFRVTNIEPWALNVGRSYTVTDRFKELVTGRRYLPKASLDADAPVINASIQFILTDEGWVNRSAVGVTVIKPR